MSTALAIITDSFTALGVNSDLKPVAQELLDDALPILRSTMETLRKNDIILEETVSGVTTTIALPAALANEIDEPVAARMHLIHYLAVNLIPLARVGSDTLKIPTQDTSMGEMSKMYRVHVIPRKTPSTFLPRGQGHRNYRIGGAFFNGEALTDDAST